MTKYTVQLSQQNLADFLDDNSEYMESYRAELERQLGQIGTAEVEISRNALNDIIMVDDDAYDDEGIEIVQSVMARMGNDLDRILN